jgi:nucleotide-binding universal stress UspA family protein
MIILLAVDGSERSLAAVRHALGLVEQGLRASFVLVNVQEAPHLYEVVLARDVEIVEGASHAAGEHALAAARQLLSGAGLSFEAEIVTGDAAQGLIDAAERYGCDAILMGTHGSGWLASTRLGRVALSVLQHAQMPVTIVRQDEPADDQAANLG